MSTSNFLFREQFIETVLPPCGTLLYLERFCIAIGIVSRTALIVLIWPEPGPRCCPADVNFATIRQGAFARVLVARHHDGGTLAALTDCRSSESLDV